jgi:DNA-binding NtrC family response regulator
LKNDMEYLAATVEGSAVEPWHLPPKLGGPSQEAPASVGRDEPEARRFRPVEEELRELEKQRMREALEATSGVQTRAADLIAMPRRTFFAKMKQYGLSPREPR